MQNGAAHTVSVVDHRIIAQIFKCNEEKTLVWDGYKLDKKGKKINVASAMRINTLNHAST